jgi:hypothetical protein
MLWLTGFAGAFVFVEPSPYEYMAIATMLVFAMSGLALRAPIVPLVLLLVLINIGYAIAVVPVSDETKSLTWVFISIFLALTGIFYASLVDSNAPRRLALLLRGTVAAALVVSLIAVGAYFHLFGGASDLFLLYDRARGTFNDPNVLGAFLVMPALLLLQRLLIGRQLVRSSLMLAAMLAALFLSFSRGAWGQFALAATLLMALTFIASSSNRERVRIVLLALAGTVVIMLVIAVLLSFSQVADIFQERAALEQSYDAGQYGRFGRFLFGADVALEHPFGIGPLQFYRYFTEDPHNSFLNAFISGGWLAGFGYFALSLVTVATSTRFLFVRTPWQPIYHVLYAAYIATLAESMIIDIDHWRHYFLILGLLWGLMAASRPYRSSARMVPMLAQAAA